MNIDIHTHFMPKKLIDLIKADPVKYQAKIWLNDEGEEMITHDQGYTYPVFQGFYDLDYRIKEMDARKIDIDVLSVSPTIYYYYADSKLALEVAKVCNDSAAEMVKKYPDRFRAMATVPMQDVELAVAELERTVEEYGFKYVEIGTTIEDKNLDDPYFLPFFKKAEELGVAVMFHPYYVGDRPNLGDYYMTNLVGNPLDTTLCIARLVFGGVLEKCPNSKFIFVHAGGYIPYQRGRLQHGYKVRTEPKVILKDEAPDKFFDMLYYDTITHWEPALMSLIKTHDDNKVLLGSDYPFDMADADPVRTVKNLNLDRETEAKVLGLNAEVLDKA